MAHPGSYVEPLKTQNAAATEHTEAVLCCQRHINQRPGGWIVWLS